MPTDPALCKRLAEMVMRWKADDKPKRISLVKEDTQYTQPPGELMACTWSWLDQHGKRMCFLDSWHPDTEIDQAMMVADKIALHLELVRYENGKWKCSIHKMVHPPASYDGARVDNPALAICLAADTWLKQGGGR
jgi:Phage ABA sandwich domain